MPSYLRMHKEASPNGLPAGAKKRTRGRAAQTGPLSGWSLRENARRVPLLGLETRWTLTTAGMRTRESGSVRVIRSLQFKLLGEYRGPPKYADQKAGLKGRCQCALYEAVLPYHHS